MNAEESYKFLRYLTTEGLPMKGVTFTADKNNQTGIGDVVDLMTAENPELFDKAQAEKAVMGEIPFDKALETAAQQCQQVIDNNK